MYKCTRGKKNNRKLAINTNSNKSKEWREKENKFKA